MSYQTAFSEVRRQLTYKSEWYGKILVEVDRWYASSKICSECRYTLDELRLVSDSGPARSAGSAMIAM